MKERTTWPWIWVVAALLLWAGPSRCTGQSPESSNPGVAPAPGAPAQAGSAPSITSGGGGLLVKPRAMPLPPALDSTVAPEIERFMKQAGAKLPADTAKGTAKTPSPSASNSWPAGARIPPPVRPSLLNGTAERKPQALPVPIGSTVSPAIEKFATQPGRAVPPAPSANLVTPSSGIRALATVQPMVPPAEPKPLAMPSFLTPAVTLPPSVLAVARRDQDNATVPPLPPMGGGPGTNPLFNSLNLNDPPTEPTDLRFPINLATALRLSDARPLIVAAAQTGVWIAEAQLTRAKLLWVPTLAFGFDYYRHDGGGAPEVFKGIMLTGSLNFFYGGGGLVLAVNPTDAYFEPLVARQLLNAEQYSIQSAKNDALMQTTDAYFRVHQYRGMYAGALYVVQQGRELVDRIKSLSGELEPKVEVERAINFLADLEQRATMARQEWRVASADLTQVLRLDPRAVVEPMEHDHTQITLVDPGRTYDDLMPIALNNRPEIAALVARLQAAELRVRREKWRPILPLVMLNGLQTPGAAIEAGIFGLGPNASMNQWAGRDDVSGQLVWQLEGFGVGNLARIKGQRGLESRAVIDLRRQQDVVAGEVTRAVARVQSASARVLQADRALRTGIITFNGQLEGVGQTRRLENVLVLTVRPQEAVYALDLLNIAFNEYFTTVAEYNRAQFELYHALGYPARELTVDRVPGEVIPVNIERPAYLPQVGNGPPPAQR